MAGQLVFITGSTGFIGSQVAMTTLKAGYSVRLSVRKQEQIAPLQKLFAAYLDRVEFAVVSDITDAEVIKPALKDVDHIFHLASPMPGKGADLELDYVRPAVKGTTAILEAAEQQLSIKNVIVTSSVAALMPVGGIGKSVGFAIDNTGEIIPVNYSEVEAYPGYGVKYQASKILAHQASRDFVKTHKPHYRLITFHPSFVLGDSLIQESAGDIGGINKIFWDCIHLEKPTIANAFVHVRDVADAHVRILDVDVPNGTEFLLSSPDFKWEDVAAILRQNYPSVDTKLQPPFQQDWHIDVSSANSYLKIKWRSLEKIVMDVLDQQLTLRGEQNNLL